MIHMVGEDGRSIGTLTKHDAERIMSASRAGSRAGSRSASVLDLRKETGSISSTKANFNRIVRITLVTLCFILTVMALVLIGIGIFAPDWFYVDVVEYQQQWKIGLWLYCRRGGSLQAEVGVSGLDLHQWICDTRSIFPGVSQFVYRQSTFELADHNELPVLICLCIAWIFLFISLFALCCAYCNHYIPYCLLFTNLMSMLSSIIGVMFYIVSMQNVEARRFTTFNSVYMLDFGYACWCAIAGIIVCVLNFVFGIPMAILTFAWHKAMREEKEINKNYYKNSQIDVQEVNRLLSQKSQPADYPLGDSYASGAPVQPVARGYDSHNIGYMGGNQAPRTPVEMSGYTYQRSESRV